MSVSEKMTYPISHVYYMGILIPNLHLLKERKVKDYILHFSVNRGSLDRSLVMFHSWRTNESSWNFIEPSPLFSTYVTYGLIYGVRCQLFPKGGLSKRPLFPM